METKTRKTSKSTKSTSRRKSWKELSPKERKDFIEKERKKSVMIYD